MSGAVRGWRLLAGAAGLAVVVLAVLMLLGRSQLAAQAPVPGLQVALIRTAGLDTLLAAGVPLGQAPACATTGDAVVCLGTRADGAPIRLQGPAVAPTDAPTLVVVTVAGRVLATVDAQAAVDTAGSAP